MRFESATATVTGRIADRPDPVLAIEFHARSTNTSPVVAGHSASTISSGRELTPGEPFNLDFRLANIQGSIPLRDFYVVIASGGDGVDWTVVLE